MFIVYQGPKAGSKKLTPKESKVVPVVKEEIVEEIIPTFEEEIPVVEDYNEETLLSEINKFLEENTCEEEESMGEDY
jgi:hypothetical protein